MTVSPKPTDGRRRVVIDRVLPAVDCGRFPIKRVVGDDVVVRADVFADSHDEIGVALLWRSDDEPDWHEVRMDRPDNDRWTGSFPVEDVGRHRYTVRAWIDQFASWHRDLAKKLHAGQDVSQERLVGARLAAAAARRARGADAASLTAWATRLRDEARRAPPDGSPSPPEPRTGPAAVADR